MATVENKTVVRCERCDTETTHFISWVDPENVTHYVCWRCREREEKHINIKPTFRRDRRQPNV